LGGEEGGIGHLRRRGKSQVKYLGQVRSWELEEDVEWGGTSKQGVRQWTKDSGVFYEKEKEGGTIQEGRHQGEGGA